METRNRIEIMLDAIATATPIDNPRDRLEVFISAIASALANAGETNDIEPRDRIELLLDAIADAIGDAGLIVAESLSVTENGTYTAPSGKAYTPVTVKVPTTTIESLSVTENGTYTAPEGKSYTPVTVNVPLPENAFLLKTATAGETVSFNDGAAAPLNSLKVDVTAIQKGTGTPSSENVRSITGWSGANVYRTSQNLWDETWEQGTITLANGVNSQATNRIRTLGYIGIRPNTEYYFKNPIKESSYFIIFYYDENKTYLGQSKVLYVDNQTFTTPAEAYYMRFVSYVDITEYENNVSINYPSTDTEYHAYSGSSVSISFGSTVYGGNLDVGSGVLTVTDGNIASYNGETLPSTWISSMDVYSAEATPTTGAQVVYKLETPTNIQLTPVQIMSILGTNNIYVDCGAITDCKYYSKMR